MIYAVIDTNVLVSALFTHTVDAATARVVEALMQGKFVPLYIVTGNQKHFPKKPIVVTPAEMMEILGRKDQQK